MSVSIVQLLKEMSTHNASDLHLKQDAQPVYRIHGALTPVKRGPVTREEMERILDRVLTPDLRAPWERDGAVDFAFSLDSLTRYRTNVYNQRGKISMAFRRLHFEDLSFQELGLPEVMNDLADLRRGMVLITGPAGAGKSTTMAALIDRINSTRREHILTLEDPIEFIFDDKKSVIEQREIGTDAIGFEVALKHAMRQDPDVILVGEMCDKETIASAIHAALAGRLVISTLHTINAVTTVNRVIRCFPPDQQGSIREDLGDSLRAAVSQRLICAEGGKRRLPIVEVMLCNAGVAKLIKENRIDEINQVIQKQVEGMRSFDQSLIDLVHQGVIGASEGEKFCDNLQAYRRGVKGEIAGGDSV